MTQDQCEGSHLNLQQQGNLRTEIKFDTTLVKTISVFVYAEFENIIEIA